MNLGENIYSLRSKHGLSQEELAEKLQVSRQSVSKWENNSAIPDLEKIIRMSELFGVSVDALVKEKEDIKDKKEETPQQVVQIIQKESMEKRVLAAIILLCTGGLAFVLLFVLTGLGCLYALPVLACGAVCLVCKKNPGFYCAWLLYLLITEFLSFATAVSSWRVIRYTFQEPYNGNPATILIAWAWFFAMLALLGWSAAKFARQPVVKRGKPIVFCVIGTVYLLAEWIVGSVLTSHYLQLAESGNGSLSSAVRMMGLVNSVSTVLEPVFACLLLIGCVQLLLYFLKKRKNVSC